MTDADAERMTLSRSTVKHALDTLRRILAGAVTDHAIGANPCAALPRNRSTDAKLKRAGSVLTEGQVAAVADHVGRVQGVPLYALVVMFAAFTGVRESELAGLNVGDIWLPNSPGAPGSVTVDRQRFPDASATSSTGLDIPGWAIDTLKTPKAYRTVPIDGWLADDMRAYLATEHPYGDRASSSYRPDTSLFPGRYGRAE